MGHWSMLVPLLLNCLATNAYTWSNETKEIPEYIVKHSPLVHLYSEELYYPGSIDQYVSRFMMSTADYNLTAPLSLSNLTSSAKEVREKVNDEKAELYLTSREQWQNEEGHEDWLTNYKTNKPNIWNGYISNAYSTLIVVDKPDMDFVDAFWFYFYPYNLGPFVMGRGPFGDHLGDWEHSVVRFNRSSQEPLFLWMSAHGGGAGYTYESMLDQNVLDPKRPAIYSARGTHAQYSSTGRHPHDIPYHMLSDFTDNGDLWDPSLNHVAYVLDEGSEVVYPANGTESGRELELGDWLLFDGHWGNKKLEPQDVRQQWSPFEWRIIDGPRGPLSKNLERKTVCERSKWWNLFKRCHIRQSITLGEGWDATGNKCEILNEYTPAWLLPVTNLVTSGGWVCFWVDRMLS
ncbi:Vps62 protein [Starmerella bacillaris]|uniref:Vps62 protein n=1 Tax=Starmerella bacillaris TaxID=1247836 RepID=A0AAV5RMY8_STABA|nr:Vps62 protein [Starmerella bacillaris]